MRTAKEIMDDIYDADILIVKLLGPTAVEAAVQMSCDLVKKHRAPKK